MKISAMQDLREDLMLTIDSTKEALLEIENVAIRTACQEVVRLTLKSIIGRIDDELLEMEKQQIIDAFVGYDSDTEDNLEIAEQYYNETFKNK